MKKILLASVLLTSLMLIAIPTGYTGNPPPPPPDMKYVGPNIGGHITITPSLCTEGYIMATFVGKCGETHFSIGPAELGGGFDFVTPDFLEGQSLGYIGEQIPLECAPKKGGYDTEVRIVNVTEFSKIGNVITAHIVAKSLVPK
jgi:hypothetical protein